MSVQSTSVGKGDQHGDQRRDRRWNMRVDADEDALVRAASEASGEGLTEFVRSAALVEAERVLADRVGFALDEQQWARLNEMLDRPARVPPGLAHLFSRPSVFE